MPTTTNPQGTKLGETIEAYGTGINQAISEARDQVGNIKAQLDSTSRQVREVVRQNPRKALAATVAVSAGLGLLAGLFLRRRW